MVWTDNKNGVSHAGTVSVLFFKITQILSLQGSDIRSLFRLTNYCYRKLLLWQITNIANYYIVDQETFSLLCFKGSTPMVIRLPFHFKTLYRFLNLQDFLNSVPKFTDNF